MLMQEIVFKNRGSFGLQHIQRIGNYFFFKITATNGCLLYTSDAADE